MAGPISHIVYAKKYFEKNPSNINKDEFILGCSFPDIRRISDGIKRQDTHFPSEDLVDLKINGKANSLNLDFTGLTPFHAGWKFHLYCDMKREEILKEADFYSLDNTADFWSVPSKFLEDELLYHEYNNWEKIYLYFNHAPWIKPLPNVSRETFELWYAILAKYLEEKPKEKSIHAYLTKQLFLKDKADKIIESLAKIRKNIKAAEILKTVPEKIIN
jgi:hypothetical protein